MHFIIEDLISFQQTMNSLRRSNNLCRSLFFLPCTAGNYLPNKSFDGFISALVTLSVLTAVAISVLFWTTDSAAQTEVEKIDPIRIVLILVISMAILTSILFIHYRSNTAINRQINDTKTMMIKFKLLFLGLFSVACIYDLSIRITVHLTCKDYPNDENITRVVYEIFRILFHSFMFIFIVTCMFFKRVFYKNCLTHYGATILVVANASIFLYHSFKFYYEDERDNSNITMSCINDTFLRSLYEVPKPYLEPTGVENSLFAILLIKEIFSTTESTYKSRNPSPVSYDDTPDTVTTHPENSESKYKALFTAVTIILINICTCIALFMIKHYQLGSEGYGFDIVQSIVYAIVKVAMYAAQTRCFYYLVKHGESYVHTEKVPLEFDHYLLLLSAFGSFIYFVLQFISSIRTNVAIHRIYALKNAMNIITTFTQTVLILHLKDYKNIKDKRGIFSISNTFLYLSLVNFSFWLFDSFYEAHVMYISEYTVEFYGLQTWITIRHMLFPLIVFYRFRCFLTFLEQF